MTGMALPMIRIGNKTINLINVCYWEEIEGRDAAQLIEITYPGPTRCCLNVEESAQFRGYMAKASAAAQSPIIQASNLPLGFGQ